MWQWALPGLSSIAIWPFQPFALPLMDKMGRKSMVSITLSCSVLLLGMTPYVGSFWNAWVVRCMSRIFIQVSPFRMGIDGAGVPAAVRLHPKLKSKFLTFSGSPGTSEN
jgi:MFS family permease